MSSISRAAGYSLAGVVLVALALPEAGLLGPAELPRGLTIVAVVLAVLTTVAGLGAGLLRFRQQLTRAAGVLLMATTAMIGSAAIAVLAGSPPPATEAAEGMTVVITGLGEAAELTATAELLNVPSGELVRAEVTTTPDGGERIVLARQTTVARGNGPVTVDLTAAAVGQYDMLQVLVESPDRRCTVNVRPQISETPVASCRAR